MTITVKIAREIWYSLSIQIISNKSHIGVWGSQIWDFMGLKNHYIYLIILGTH